MLLGITLTLPPVQTRLGAYVTEKINKDFGTDIKVDQIAISVFGGVKLRQVLIRDHHKDTLIYAKRLQTNILSFRKLYNGDLLFGRIASDKLLFNLKTYKGEKDTNLDRFIALFDSKDNAKPSGHKFLMKANEIVVSNGHFLLTDENRANPKDVDFSRLDGRLTNFRVFGPEVTMDIRQMAFLDHRGLYVRNLSGLFLYDKKHIKLTNMEANTAQSLLKADVLLTYDRKDFADFNNKVKFDINVKQGLLSTNDIHYFYKELGPNRTFSLSAKVNGTLNNLKARHLKLTDNHNARISGDVQFKNLFNTAEKGFYMKGDFEQVASDYDNLVGLLPNVLGKKLPSSLKKIGRFDLSGSAEITMSSIQANFEMQTALGRIQSDLVMTDIDNIDQAKYTGNIVLDNFDIGDFLGKRDLGIVSLDLDVDGQGFTQKFLNTSFSGDVYKIRYQNYVYTNILVNGKFKDPVFKGNVYINDPNLLMDFKGSANLGKKDIAYDFEAQIDYANLRKMKIVTNDSISVLKGNILMNVRGNSLEDLKGNVYVSQSSYQSGRNLYVFDDLIMTSSFDADGLRTISVNSPDIINGKITGKYKISQIQLLIENSLGSLYTNYRPNKILKNQFLDFDFEVNDKIVDLFTPDIDISDSTKVSGSINSNTNQFLLDLTSPKITAYENRIDNIKMHVDNLHPVYNAQIEIDSISNKFYKIKEFSLFNVTSRDTLFIKSGFKGGKNAGDQYELNLYHTIDKDHNVVVGFLQSALTFKENEWHINEKGTADNKIIMSRDLKNFRFDNIVISHEDHKASFNGTMRGKEEKDLNLVFDNVDLSKITPDMQGIVLEGKMDGTVSLKQQRLVYQPMAALKIDELAINNIDLGKLSLDIDGDGSFRKFYVNSVLENKNFESFRADGEFDVSGPQTAMDIDLKFDRFNIGTLDGLLSGEAISNIKGFASGNISIAGTVAEPDVNGRLYAEETSLTVPYLNVNYLLDPRSVIDVTEDKFLIHNSGITDTKYNTKGNIEGTIEHKKFSDWKLDIKVSSDKLLALDTQDSDDAAYYGTAFIDGYATISGPTNALFIKAKAASAEGTSIKIPISNTESTTSRSYIHFQSPQEKYSIEKGIVIKQKEYSGLEIDLDFDINKNAEVEVILDKNTGHSLKAKGDGSIQFGINTLGRFNMFGNYVADEGIYNFKYGGLIDKKFKIKKGGTITWEGDPLRAVLNMEAVYTTTANPAVLLENPSVNKKVPVEVVVGVRGNLTNPEPDFQINFPTVSSVLKSEIQYKLDDKDVRNTQALYLLSSGTFLSPEGVSQSDFTGNLFETASGLIGDIFQDPDSNIQLGFDYQAADRRPGTETDGRVGVSVSTQVNERISINGKVGVPVGGVNESAIVGDVEVQYRVNDDGSLNLRVFNRENDITYLGQGIGYTQGVGFTYEVDFDTFRELVDKVFKVKIDLDPATDTVPDSDYVPDGMRFPSKDDKKDKKKDDKPKPNVDAVIPGDD
ncbi:translocation/assembly module TamB domain-containing protein [Flavobacterium silvaticum]|uniref:translocation/assembly module TamB domain-containing protein n=1 Tax=Flavobacterium silvaticum TaxID=1852020 RepID=UPI001F177856|nr:translocation/assembly module TamB [Flavobacterium silvaticum]